MVVGRGGWLAELLELLELNTGQPENSVGTPLDAGMDELARELITNLRVEMCSKITGAGLEISTLVGAQAHKPDEIHEIEDAFAQLGGKQTNRGREALFNWLLFENGNIWGLIRIIQDFELCSKRTEKELLALKRYCALEGIKQGIKQGPFEYAMTLSTSDIGPDGMGDCFERILNPLHLLESKKWFEIARAMGDERVESYVLHVDRQLGISRKSIYVENDLTEVPVR